MTVLCLIANPAAPELDPNLASAVCAAVGGSLRWLHRPVACEIIDPQARDPLRIARELIGSRAVDAALVPSANRRKLVLVADMDSTMIQQECIDELAAVLGLKETVSEITARAMRGELDFGQALETRVALLKDLELRRIEEVRSKNITLTPGGRVLVQTMRAHGAYASLVSGGFTVFADYFAELLGFDEAVANVLEFSGNRLTGTVAKPIVDKTTKLRRLQDIAGERGISLADTMAVGDGANDLEMIRAAGLGVAIHAKPAVAAEAAVRIDHGDLTALLYLQGYSAEEFAV